MHTMRVSADDGLHDNALITKQPAVASVIKATLLGFEADGSIRVLLPGEHAAVPALSAVRLSEEDVGQSVLLAFSLRPGDVPVITGRCDQQPNDDGMPARPERDRVVIRASREIELRCGNSSIVLTRAGKVLIRGDFVLSHSRGMNRIRGASVHIN